MSEEMKAVNARQEDQRIQIGADVLSSNGEKIGSVAYVVVLPPEMRITDIVVSTGAILGRDVVVPIDAVERVANGQVHLTLDKDGLERCRDYVEVQYQQPPETWAPPTGAFYPSNTMLWPAGTAYDGMPASVTVNAPAGTFGVHEGMNVESSDGHRVGSIDAIDRNPDSGDVTAFIVKQGHLFTHDARISIDLVAGVDDDTLRLKAPKDALETELTEAEG